MRRRLLATVGSHGQKAERHLGAAPLRSAFPLILETRNPITSQPSGLQLRPDLGYDVPPTRRCCGIQRTGQGTFDGVVEPIVSNRSATSNRILSFVIR